MGSNEHHPHDIAVYNIRSAIRSSEKFAWFKHMLPTSTLQKRDMEWLNFPWRPSSHDFVESFLTLASDVLKEDSK